MACFDINFIHVLRVFEKLWSVRKTQDKDGFNAVGSAIESLETQKLPINEARDLPGVDKEMQLVDNGVSRDTPYICGVRAGYVLAADCAPLAPLDRCFQCPPHRFHS